MSKESTIHEADVLVIDRDCQSCFLCERECPEKAIEVVPFFERRVPVSW